MAVGAIGYQQQDHDAADTLGRLTSFVLQSVTKEWRYCAVTDGGTSTMKPGSIALVVAGVIVVVAGMVGVALSIASLSEEHFGTAVGVTIVGIGLLGGGLVVNAVQKREPIE